MPDEKKQIVVTGDGPYLGYLISEGLKQHGKATWYDQTKNTKIALEIEKKLVEGGKVKQSDLKKASGAKSGGKEKDCDVVIKVKGDKIIVSKSKGGRTSFTTKKVESMSDLKKVANDVMKAVTKLLA